MPFWRRGSGEEAQPNPLGQQPAAINPETAEPDWEPDPVDFEITGPPRAVADLEPRRVEPGVPAAPAPTAATLDAGLQRTRTGFMSRLRGLLGSTDAVGPSWDDVEETLIAGDIGAALAVELVERARARRDPGGSEAAIRGELAGLLVPRERNWAPARATADGPAVILVVGVNGTGKTTTIGKLAGLYGGQGRSVILAAADTFRAAAIDQLRILGGPCRRPSGRPRSWRGPRSGGLRRPGCRCRAGR